MYNINTEDVYEYKMLSTIFLTTLKNNIRGKMVKMLENGIQFLNENYIKVVIARSNDAEETI